MAIAQSGGGDKPQPAASVKEREADSPGEKDDANEKGEKDDANEKGDKGEQDDD